MRDFSNLLCQYNLLFFHLHSDISQGTFKQLIEKTLFTQS